MKQLLVLLFFSLFGMALFAQGAAYDFLDINQVSAQINCSPYQYMDDLGTNHYKVPKAGGTDALFCFSLWMGGIDSSQQLHLAGGKYSGITHDYWPGPVSDSIYYDSAYDATWNKVWKINKSDIDYHRNHYWVSGYTAPGVILNWPWNGDPAKGQSAILAPFADLNNNGIYEPMQGDYPLIKGDQAVFFILNDNRALHTETGGKSLGVEIHAMAYAFDCPSDSALVYTTFLHYDIFNKSSVRYDSSYVGAFVDTDLGYAWDDYIGCDVGRGSFYDYNGVNIDGNGAAGSYGAFPPAVSVTVLGGPFLDPDFLDNLKVDGLGNPVCDVSINGDNFGDGIVDNERYGMSRFLYNTNCSSGPTCDPIVAADYYKLMCGKWKDGVPMQYGGNGHPNSGATGPECKFMFPDLSDFCNWGTNGVQPPAYITGAGGNGVSWTEANVMNPPNDRRGTISMGPFTFKPGAHQEIHLAIVWARQYSDSSAMAAVDLLKTRIDQVRTAYEMDSVSCGGSFSGIEKPQKSGPEIVLYPNPANTVLNVNYPGKTGQVAYHIYNVLGEYAGQGILQNNSLNQVNVGNLSPGIYVMVIRDRGVVKTARFIKR